ncbi:MAG: KH domain-containing protein [Candidatus Pacebacteria bacterium]|nr:KH domain-containing protein [Candidatus Paceibacterota bacterium]
MIDNLNLNKIKKVLEEFFQKAGFIVEIKSVDLYEDTISIKIKTEEPQILIGQNGQTLSEVQYLIKSILRKDIDQKFYVDIDINSYKEKKTEYLKETARSLADEVVLSKREKILSPMSSYDRRIIHLELINREDVETESIGEEPERRLIIRPKA